MVGRFPVSRLTVQSERMPGFESHLAVRFITDLYSGRVLQAKNLGSEKARTFLSSTPHNSVDPYSAPFSLLPDT